MVSAVRAAPSFTASVPRTLFVAPRGYQALATAGERWLCLVPVGSEQPSTVNVTLDWTLELKSR